MRVERLTRTPKYVQDSHLSDGRVGGSRDRKGRVEGGRQGVQSRGHNEGGPSGGTDDVDPPTGTTVGPGPKRRSLVSCGP